MANPPSIRTVDGIFGGQAEARTPRSVEVPEPLLHWIRVDHQTRFQFGDVEVVIESPFTLRSDGVIYELDPGNRHSLGPAMAVYPDTLDSATVDRSATLVLKFTSGIEITVPADVNYEAWSVVGPGHALLVCMPGNEGEIAAWSDSGRR